jgi:hypothetical protein
VMEVYVRQGRVVDPSDDSEGTRDRPPTSDQLQTPAVVPLDENPLLNKLPESEQSDAESPSEEPAATDSGSARDKASSETVDNQNPITEPFARTHQFTRSSRWSPALIGLGLDAGGWRARLEAALESADHRSWQRLRRAGRVGRIIRPVNLADADKTPLEASIMQSAPRDGFVSRSKGSRTNDAHLSRL